MSSSLLMVMLIVTTMVRLKAVLDKDVVPELTHLVTDTT